MSEAPQSKPPGSFPWIACVIVGAIVLTFVMVGVVFAIGFYVFLKPKPAPTGMTPDQMQEMMQKMEKAMPPMPAPPEAMSKGVPPEGLAPPTAALSAEDAVAAVKARPEVAAWLAAVTAAGGSPHIDVDSEDAAAYTVHVFEVVAGEGDLPSHTATLGWYSVDKGTGEVKQEVP